jgi:hypothetical protein
MNCMMKKCVHPATTKSASGCDLFGECGCRYALERARELDGLLVHMSGNMTIDALRRAGLVTVTNNDGYTGLVRAVASKADAA